MSLLQKSLIAVFLIVVGYSRYLIAESSFQTLSFDLASGNTSNISLTGSVFEISSQSPARTSFLLDSDTSIGTVFVVAKSLGPLEIGQKLTVIGEIERFANLEQTSFKDFLKLKRAFAVMDNALVVIENEYRYTWRYYANYIRSSIQHVLFRNFSRDSGGLLLAVLLGDTASLSDDVREGFRQAGLSHVMAISGANMTLLAESLFSLLPFLTLKKKIFVVIITLTVFTLIVGASAAVIRAFVMALISFFGLYSGKPYLASRALVFVILGVYIWDPFIVLFDIGFQLSVAATGGLLIGVPIMKHYFKSHAKTFWFQSLAITISATIAVTPLSLHYFGVLSLLSPLINIIFAPVFSYLSILGYALLLFSFVPLLGSIICLVADVLLRLILLGVSQGASIAALAYLAWQPLKSEVVGVYGLAIAILWARKKLSSRP